MTTRIAPGVKGGIGTSVLRPDGEPKVTGNFAYASDLSSEDMLWGATLRSPHAHARLLRIDTSPALAMAGVRAVLTQDDVPGEPLFGQEEQDQPVFCDGFAHASQPLIALFRGNRQVRMHSRDTNSTVFFVVKSWTAEPATQEPRQLVARRFFVGRVHLPNRRKTLIAAHSVEERVDEPENASFTACGLKRHVPVAILWG